VRDNRTGDWSQPAFYTIGSVSIGLQIGDETAEVIMMAMSQKAIDSLLASSFKKTVIFLHKNKKNTDIFSFNLRV
jgi:lipid-binding SYLF domain-containing protein